MCREYPRGHANPGGLFIVGQAGELKRRHPLRVGNTGLHTPLAHGSSRRMCANPVSVTKKWHISKTYINS